MDSITTEKLKKQSKFKVEEKVMKKNKKLGRHGSQSVETIKVMAVLLPIPTHPSQIKHPLYDIIIFHIITFDIIIFNIFVKDLTLLFRA